MDCYKNEFYSINVRRHNNNHNLKICLTTPVFTIFNRSEVVVVSQTSTILKFNTLFCGLIEEVTLIFAGTWTNNFGQETGINMITTSIFAFLFGFKAIPVALAASIVETVTSTICLIVVPFRNKTTTRSCVLLGITN